MNKRTPNCLKPIFASLALLASWGGHGVWAQQVPTGYNLTLETCIEMAQENSPEARIAKDQFLIARYNFKAFRAGLKPQINLSGSTPGLQRAITSVVQDDGSLLFVSQNQANSNLNLGFSQQIGPTGATLSLSSNLNRIDVFGVQAYTSWQATPLLLSLRQPVFRYNDLKWQQKLQPKRFSMAERQYLERIEDISTDICGKFFDVYLAGMRLQTAEKNLSINDSIFQISQGRFKMGKIAENDLLQTELAYQNARLAVDQGNLELTKAREDLAISLGLSTAQPLAVIPPGDLPLFPVDIDFALLQAKQNRSDMMSFDIRAMEAESEVARTKSATTFNADISASFGLNQTGNTLDQAYTNPPDQETFGIGFQVPIFTWGANKAQREAALVGRDQVNKQIQLDMRRLERDIRFQVLDFQQLQQQLILASRSDTVAQRRFEVAKNRYLIGKIDITNLQLAQNEKDNARQVYFSTLKNYWVSYFRLRRSTLYDFREDQALRIGTEEE